VYQPLLATGGMCWERIAYLRLQLADRSVKSEIAEEQRADANVRRDDLNSGGSQRGESSVGQ